MSWQTREPAGGGNEGSSLLSPPVSRLPSAPLSLRDATPQAGDFEYARVRQTGVSLRVDAVHLPKLRNRLAAEVIPRAIPGRQGIPRTQKKPAEEQGTSAGTDSETKRVFRSSLGFYRRYEQHTLDHGRAGPPRPLQVSSFFSQGPIAQTRRRARLPQPIRERDL
jgi:hypothetical protein